MRKTILVIALLSTAFAGKGQNLVPNGDFEQYSSCPTNYSQLDTALFWFKPTNGTSDYFNQCNTSFVGVPNNIYGHQFAHSGVGYGGGGLYAFGDNREYLEIQLLTPLMSGICYHFEMFVNSANNVKFATDDLGVYFSNSIIDSAIWTNLPYIPQINNTTGFITDTLNWTLISGNYTATGGESYLIIGNFKDNLNTDSLLFNNQAFYPYAYVYIDDVSLTPCTGIEENNNEAITIYPNPVKDELTISSKLPIAIGIGEKAEIIIRDVLGREIMRKQFNLLPIAIGINLQSLQKGIYLYEIKNNPDSYRDGVIKKGKIVKE